MFGSVQDIENSAEMPGIVAGPPSEVTPAEMEPRRSSQWGEMPDFPHPLRRPLSAIAWVIHFLFSLFATLLLLSLAATVPVLNLLALGYLLDSQARIARSGRWWQAMPGLPVAGRLGSIALGCGIWALPVWYLADVARDAVLIAPGSRPALIRQLWFTLGMIGVAIHLALALARGGCLSCFFRPFKNLRWLLEQCRKGNYWRGTTSALGDFLSATELPHRLWLGSCALLGTAIWLIVPTLLLATFQDPVRSWQQLLILLGGACLVPVLAWLPFLQVRMSAENRWPGIFELRAVRELFTRAPVAWTIATVALYAGAVPLFLWSAWFKMQIEPHRGILDLTLISVITTYPGRVLVAWAYHRATQRQRSWSGWIWLMRVVLATLLPTFVYLLFLSSMTAEFGRHWLNQYHALLLPIPW